MKKMKRVWSILLTVCMLLGLVTLPANAMGAPSMMEIAADPEDVTVAYGEDATFTVEAEGEVVSYQWVNYWDEPMTAPKFTGANTATLTVHDVGCGFNDIGFYCIVTGVDGDQDSEPAFLTVKGHAAAEYHIGDEKSHMESCGECGALHNMNAHVFGNDDECDVCGYYEGVTAPPMILDAKNIAYAWIGDDVQFFVKAYGPGLTYQWYKDNGEDPLVPMEDDAEVQGTETRRLTLKNVDCRDAEYEYVCRVKNDVGEEYVTCILEVEHQPVSAPVDGSKHSFVCEICEQFMGEEIHYDYDCDGVCDGCDLTFAAGAPKITVQPEDFEGKNGHAPVTYKVTATGEDLTYQWYFNGQKVPEDAYISGGKTDTLTVKSCYNLEKGYFDCASDYYSFYCIVSNEEGAVESRYATYFVEHAGVAYCEDWNERFHELYCRCGNWIEDVPHVDDDADYRCDDCGRKLMTPFKDVTDRNAWYYEAAMFGKAEGFFKGDNGNFKPDDNITRGEMVTVLARIAYTQEFIDGMNDYEFEEFLAEVAEEYGTTPVNFTDVKGTFYERHARILAALGVVNGYANNLFKGEANITREELAAILVRYVYLFGDGIVFDEPIDSFKDADKISDWAVDVVDAAREMGIFKGDNGNFKPRSNALRSEVAQTMLRMEVYNGMLASY